MVEFPDKNIYLYSEGIDFRKGIKSLFNLISVNYPNSNLTDSVIIFFSKDKKQAKLLEIEEDDIWLYQNKLNNAKFVFPKCVKTIKIDSRQLKLKLEIVCLLSKLKLSMHIEEELKKDELDLNVAESKC